MIKRDDKATQRKTKINKKEKTHYNSEISQDFRKYSTDMRRQDN